MSDQIPHFYERVYERIYERVQTSCAPMRRHVSQAPFSYARKDAPVVLGVLAMMIVNVMMRVMYDVLPVVHVRVY